MCINTIVSINLNKRLNTEEYYTRFVNWLSMINADILLLQEPYSHSKNSGPIIPNFSIIGGNSNVSMYCSNHLSNINFTYTQHTDRWSSITLNNYQIHNTYFPSDKSSNRISLMNKMITELATEKKHLIFGDFNLAPTVLDGLYDGQTSKFTTKKERSTFAQLLQENSLSDFQSGNCINFTFEKKNRNKLNQFRCDLALINKSILRNFTVSIKYDHDVRKSGNAFTDHSAIILNISQSLY